MGMLPLNSDMLVMMKTIMMLLQQGGGLTCKGGMSVPQVLRLFLSLSHSHIILLLLLCFNSLIACWLDVDILAKVVGKLGKAWVKRKLTMQDCISIPRLTCHHHCIALVTIACTMPHHLPHHAMPYIHATYNI